MTPKKTKAIKTTVGELKQAINEAVSEDGKEYPIRMRQRRQFNGDIDAALKATSKLARGLPPDLRSQAMAIAKAMYENNEDVSGAMVFRDSMKRALNALDRAGIERVDSTFEQAPELLQHVQSINDAVKAMQGLSDLRLAVKVLDVALEAYFKMR